MARLCSVLGLLGLAGRCLALRLDAPNLTHKASSLEMARRRDVDAECVPPAAYRQQLTNMMDLQYFTEIVVGGQRITGILDTGSFELVVFSRRCTTCGRAGVYDADSSSTFRGGDMIKVHAYGSGSCKSREGSDEVTLGCYKTPKQALWLAMECNMQLLQAAGFQSIVGVGPPGQPEFTARETIRQLEELEVKMRAKGEAVPKDLQEAKSAAQKELEDAVDKRSLLESFGMGTFSTCLGRKPGSPAWMIWNDITRAGNSGVIRIPVVGNITWGIALQGMALELAPSSDTDVASLTELAVGCEKGCGAVVDTGTSLLSVPTSTYRAIASILEKHVMANDCSDLSRFPTLIITVAGSTLRLPPSSYIGTVSGEPSAQAAQYMHLSSGVSEGDACQLLLMDLGMELTQFGPMVILGMPLFREFYTTFDLGSGRGHRSIFLSPAGESCNPDDGPQPAVAAAVDGVAELTGRARAARNRDAFTPRHVDLSKVRAPEWLRRRSSITV